MRITILHTFLYLITMLLLFTQCKEVSKPREPLFSMALTEGVDYSPIKMGEWKIKPHEFYWDTNWWDGDSFFSGLKLDIENTEIHEKIEVELYNHWFREADGKWREGDGDGKRSMYPVAIGKYAYALRMVQERMTLVIDTLIFGDQFYLYYDRKAQIGNFIIEYLGDYTDRSQYSVDESQLKEIRNKPNFKLYDDESQEQIHFEISYEEWNNRITYDDKSQEQRKIWRANWKDRYEIQIVNYDNMWNPKLRVVKKITK